MKPFDRPGIRRRRTRVAFAALAATGALACSSPAPRPGAPGTRGPAAATARGPRDEGAAAAPTMNPYDEDGALLPGDEQHLGLALPRSFTRDFCARGLCSFESRVVPMPKLKDYVAARVVAANVEPLGTTGFVFRNATVKDADMDGHLVDIFVVRLGAGSDLRMQDIPPVPETAGERDRIEEANRAFRNEAQ